MLLELIVQHLFCLVHLEFQLLLTSESFMVGHMFNFDMQGFLVC
jgi:hypothetical protein